MGNEEKNKGSPAVAAPFAPGQPIPSATRAACDWPVGRFRFFDSPGEHDPCYVVMPDGASLAVNHHAAPGVDIARAKFIVAACNAHGDLVAALQEAALELAAMVADPKHPNFHPACANPADADCLHRAYQTIRAALSKEGR